VIKEARSIKLGSHGQERLLQILDKTKNLDRVLAMLSPGKLDSGFDKIRYHGSMQSGKIDKSKRLTFT